MVEISNNGIISLNRGDQFEFPLFMNQGNKMYPIRYSLLKDLNLANVYFSITLPGQEFQNGLIRKAYSNKSPHNENGDIIISLTSQETMCLKPGKYFYSIKIVYNDSNGNQKIATIVPERMFIVKG